MNDWLIQQRDKKELESQTLQSELKFLKSQINPHFLFNTLNSLYAPVSYTHLDVYKRQKYFRSVKRFRLYS